MGVDPCLTVQDWINFLQDDSIFNVSKLAVLKRIKDFGGEASCKQLSDKYGESWHYYLSNSAMMGKRVAKRTNCPVAQREDGRFFWTGVLYLLRKAEKDEAGSFIFILRPELARALKQVNLSHVPLYAEPAGRPENNFNRDASEFSKMNGAYSIRQIIDEGCFIPQRKLETILQRLKKKKNIILQAPPGTGKTWLARRLAFALIGKKDNSYLRSCFSQGMDFA